MIRIGMNKNQQYNNTREKFRFQTTRTFNGSENKNWRAPKIFEETSPLKQKSFSTIDFFRNTPPPYFRTQPTPPPAASSACPVSTSQEASSTSPNQTSISAAEEFMLTSSGSASTIASLESPENTPQVQKSKSFFTSTPLNPFRCSRRQIIYPRTPNLLNPLPASLPSPESLASMSPSPTSTQSSTDKNEAIINVMKAIYKGSRY